MLAAFAMAVLAIAPPSARAATQYGAGAFTWDNGTTAKWSSTPGGPNYNTVWTSGNDAVFEGTAGTVTLASPTAHNLTFTTTGYTLSGASTLTLSGSTPTIGLAYVNGATATIGNNTATVLAGSAGLTTNAYGRLSQGNNYTQLTLNGSAVHTFTGGVTVNNTSQLNVDLRNLATPTDLVNNGNSLTLAGGQLNLTGKGSAVTSQTFASTTLNKGGSVINLTLNSATKLTGVLNGITRNAGATLLFPTVPNATTTIATTTNSNETSGILAPWAAVGATTSLQYGTVNGSGQIVSYTTATTTAQPSNLSDVTSASTNYAFGATPSPTLSGPITANTLRFTGAAGTLTAGTGNNLTLNSFMNAGTGVLNIGTSAGPNANLVIGANQELVVWNDNQSLNLYTPITDSLAGTSSVVFAGSNSSTIGILGKVNWTGSTTVNLGYGGGSGQLTIQPPSSSWSYTGNWTVNGGKLYFRGDVFAGGGSFAVGNITVNPGGLLVGERGNFTTGTLYLNGGTYYENNGFSGSWAGPIVLQADSFIGTPAVAANQKIAVGGIISGTGGLTVYQNTGPLVLNNANTYSGKTYITGGSIQLGASGSINNTPLVAIGAGCTFDVSLKTSPYTWSSNTTLAATSTASLATLKGASSGTINMGSQPIVLTYDGSHVPLTVSQGTLALSGNPFTVNGSTLLPGAYTMISQTTGSVSSTGTLPGVNGTAIPTGKIGYITTSGTTPGLVTLNIAAPTLTVSGFPGSETAGTSATVTVTAKDPNGNTATAYTGTVTFSSSDAQAVLPASYTFVPADNGTHTFNVTLKTVATQSITATDSVAGVSGAQTGITVTPAAAASLLVSGFPNPTTAGVAGNVTVTAKDAYGNTATGYTGTIDFTSSDGSASLPSLYTFSGSDNGTRAFSATLNTVGTQTLTATDTLTGTIAGTQTGIVVNPNTIAAYLTVDGISNPFTAGTPSAVNVTAHLANGATATGYTGTIHFTSSDGAASLPSDYTFVSGDNGSVSLVGVDLKTVGSQSVTATDTVTSIHGSQTVSVTSAAAATLTVAGFPSLEWVGTAGSVTVTAHDAYNNIATGYVGTVHFTSSDGGATLPADYTFVSGDNGTHTFTGGVTFATAGSQSITATDTAAGTITGTQSGITINLVPHIFSWTNNSGGNWGTAGNWTNDAGVTQAPVVGGQTNYVFSFNQSGACSVTNNLGTNYQLNQINFGGAATTLQGSNLKLEHDVGAPNINQNSANTATISNDIVLDANTTLGGTGSGQVILTGVVSGAGSLTKTSPGNLTLSSLTGNPYAGGTVVNAGSISLGNTVSGLLGTGSVTMNSGTTLNLNATNLTNSLALNSATVSNTNGFSAVINGPVSITGTCTLDQGNTGNFTVAAVISGTGGITKTGTVNSPMIITSANTYTGTTTISAGLLQLGNGGTTGSLAPSSSITNNATLVFNRNNTVTQGVDFSTVISGSGTLTQAGTGTLILSGSNPYTGTTAVNGGTLLVNGTNSGTGAVTVASTATLGGTGTIGGSVTYASGAFARFTQGSPLAITGTLTLNNNVVHLVLPTDLTAGTYTLATYLASGSTGSFNATPVIDSGSLATGATASVTTGSGFVKLVVSGGSDYNTWANGYPGYDLSNPAVDTIGNGLTNGQKYAFGLNPTSFTDINPIKVGIDKTAGTFTYTRRATPSTTGVVYTVWTSTDLGVWNQDTGATEGTTTVAGEVETVPVTLSGAPFSDSKLFVRVKAVLP